MSEIFLPPQQVLDIIKEKCDGFLEKHPRARSACLILEKDGQRLEPDHAIEVKYIKDYRWDVIASSLEKTEALHDSENPSKYNFYFEVCEEYC